MITDKIRVRGVICHSGVEGDYCEFALFQVHIKQGKILATDNSIHTLRSHFQTFQWIYSSNKKSF